MNDIGITPVEALDPLGHEVRVRHETRHAGGRCGIPSSQRRGERLHQQASRAARKIIVEAVPHVAHGSVAIAEVRLAARIDSLGHGVAGGDDQIEGAEVPCPHRAREERQQRPVVADPRGEPLQARGVDGVRLDLRGDAALKMKEREDLRAGNHVEDALEHRLPTAHAGQPVVDDRHPPEG